MIVVYVESSALIDVISDDDPEAALALRSRDDMFVTSVLTVIEVERRLIRMRAEDAQLEREMRVRFNELSPYLQLKPIEAKVIARAKESFVVEPVRALDAIHLATMLVLVEDLKWCAVLSNDRRVRENVVAYGLTLLPSAGPL